MTATLRNFFVAAYTLLISAFGSAGSQACGTFQTDIKEPRLLALDQSEDGRLFATTGKQLIFSDQAGWELVASLPQWCDRIIVNKSGGRAMAWKRASQTPRHAVWEKNDVGLSTCSALADLALVGVERVESTWVAFGMEAEQDSKPDRADRRVLWKAPTIIGRAFVSRNEGESWESLARWEGGRIDGALLGVDGEVLLYQAGGGIKVGQILPEEVVISSTIPGTSQPVLSSLPDNYQMDGDVQGYWTGRESMCFVGRLNHYGRKHIRSSDGGVTWSVDIDRSLKRFAFVGLGKGVFLEGTNLTLQPACELVRDGRHETISNEPSGRITFVCRTASGRAWAVEDESHVLLLDEDRNAWERHEP